MSIIHPRHSRGHVWVTAAFIGTLAMVLAAGLGVLGVSTRIDTEISTALWRMLQQDGNAGFAKTLPDWALWSGTAVISYGLASAMLGVPGTWRRLVLWFTTMIVVAGWAPVLGLAAHQPAVTTPFVAALWAGVCSLVYARSHRMPCDESQAPE